MSIHKLPDVRDLELLRRRMSTQFQIPSAYDDALSYQGLIYKLIQYLKDTMQNVADWNDWLEDFVETFDTRLQDNVRVMVQELYDNGKLAELTADVITVVQDQIDAVDSRVNNLSGDVDVIENKTNELYNIYQKDSVLWYGQEPLEHAIIRAVNSKKKLKILQGVYEIHNPITVDLLGFDLIIEGSGKDEGLQSTTLVYRGEGTFFAVTGARFLTFKHINICGAMPNDTPRIRANTTGIEANISILLDNVYFSAFDTLVYWTGGYYHKSINCTFRYFNKGFDNISSNNFIIESCRILEFNNLVTITSGQGQCVISNSSVEWFTGIAINCVTGTQSQVDVVNSYIENDSDREVIGGLLGNYRTARFAYGARVLNLTGNYFFCKGIERVIWSTNNSKYVRSEGNHISYPETGTHRCYYWNNPAVERVYLNDVSRTIGSDGDEYTPVFRLNSIIGLLPGGSYIWDCYENVFEPTPT